MPAANPSSRIWIMEFVKLLDSLKPTTLAEIAIDLAEHVEERDGQPLDTDAGKALRAVLAAIDSNMGLAWLILELANHQRK